MSLSVEGIASKIYVGNLAQGITADEIKDLFQPHGEVVDCSILGDFGFVHMKSAEEAKNAIAALNGHNIKEKQIRVEQAKSRPLRKTSVKIYVGNLPVGTTEGELKSLFEKYGVVVDCHVKRNYAFVFVEKGDRANDAFNELNSSSFKGNQITVEPARPGFQSDQCFACGKKGHWSMDCRERIRNRNGYKLYTSGMPLDNTFNIFLGNLADGITDADIKPLFEQHGEVVGCDIRRNYGFVHMKDASQGKAAIAALNSHEIQGRQMRVEPARKHLVRIHVGKLAEGTTSSELKPLFEKYGNVLKCDIVTSAFIHMEEGENTKRAVEELNSQQLQGKPIVVRFSKSRSRFGMEPGPHHTWEQRLRENVHTYEAPHGFPAGYRLGRQRYRNYEQNYMNRGRGYPIGPRN